MSANLKIGLIGAGSAVFSLNLVRDLCVTEGLHGSQVWFMDPDEQRLGIVHRLASRYAAELGVDLAFERTTSREQALDGADFVINTALVGGHDHQEAMRALSERHGYYRGLTFSNFLQFGLMLDVARDMERLCPGAWLVQSGNPVFEGCTLMTRETGVKVVGLCHGHYGYRRIAQVLGLHVERVTFEATGFNHWIWMTRFEYDGEDAYPLLDEWIETKAEEFWATHKPHYGDNQMSRAAIHQYRLYGLMPIGDTPRKGGWWYHLDLESKQRWYGHLGGFDSEIGWAQYLQDLERRLESLRRVAGAADARVTEAFPPTRSGEQVVPIMDALANDEARVFQVNVPNYGQLGALGAGPGAAGAGIPDDVVVEIPALVNRSGIHGRVTRQLPRNLMLEAMLPRLWEAEMWIEAFVTGDRRLLLRLVLEDHRTRSLEQAEGLLDALMAMPANAAVAERFGWR